MPTDPRKITENRKAERDAAQSPELRQIKAIEDVADTLEAMRIDFVLFTSMVAGIMRSQPPK